MTHTSTSEDAGFVVKHPKGFRPRRGLNWAAIGLLYASYYMCRYNFRFATPYLQEEFGFSISDITRIFAAWTLAYGTGQLINGLLTDRIGGKIAMLIGAVGTILMNLVFGFSSFVGSVATFGLIALINGYFQSYGAPGMIKINAAWFHRTERGTFSGIFGFMIQAGQFAINNLAPFILAGFTIGIWIVAPGTWRLLFIIPPIITAAVAVFLALAVKETPEEAGFHGAIEDEVDNSEGVRISLKKSFVTIFTHPLIWFYAIAYACTGAVRHSSDQLAVLYFVDQLGLDMKAKPAAVFWTMNLMPMVAVFGSLGAGIVSDKFFKGHRAPVAMGLYYLLTVIIVIAAIVIFTGVVGPTPFGIVLGCSFLIAISLAVNATHSIVGSAAPMDIGGKKMAGFASGVIDSFQYYGASLALPMTGWLIDRYGWNAWYPAMSAFGLIGGTAMVLLIRKQRSLMREHRAGAVG